MRQEVYVKFAEAIARQVEKRRQEAAVKQAERVSAFLTGLGLRKAE